jgi:hypothetical protein
MSIPYTEELLSQLYNDGLIGPTIKRDFEIRMKAKSLPGKTIVKVRILAKAHGISERQVYRILNNK